jgi:hypothetical protein
VDWYWQGYTPRGGRKLVTVPLYPLQTQHRYSDCHTKNRQWMLLPEVIALSSANHVWTFVELFSADRLISVQYLTLLHDRFTSETGSVTDDATGLLAARATTGKGNGFFSCSQHPDRHSLPTQSVSATSPEVQRQGRLADNSPPSSVRLRMSGATPLLPDLPLWREQGQLCLRGILTSTI